MSTVCNCHGMLAPDCPNIKKVSDEAEERRESEAKRLADLLCPPHASLDKNGHLEPFDNCIACIRVQRDELIELLKRISTDIGQTIIEDPIRAADGWAMLSQPVIRDVQATIEPYTDAASVARAQRKREAR